MPSGREHFTRLSSVVNLETSESSASRARKAGCWHRMAAYKRNRGDQAAIGNDERTRSGRGWDPVRASPWNAGATKQGSRSATSFKELHQVGMTVRQITEAQSLGAELLDPISQCKDGAETP